MPEKVKKNPPKILRINNEEIILVASEYLEYLFTELMDHYTEWIHSESEKQSQQKLKKNKKLLMNYKVVVPSSEKRVYLQKKFLSKNNN